ncbi:MerR family transcriptional regulator [Jannaschia sp. Os4]|uniref:MerR family transcriptional regulator n=1 Tax=Jannaschia sp. Os4 TaxID=2807617 RepID=UPI00193A51B0|nr:MerR family transcriptional regulator [Jannaschia sp. Os4]MBM2576848.1 MerR family transcriptional regulator [Jannaschia sp. Os4]
MARTQKDDDAFRTIREVSDWLGVPNHVLRFWESKFEQVSPVKRAGGRRYYRPDDMRLLGGIKALLHDRGMTVRAVQAKLAEEGVAPVAALSHPLDAPAAPAPVEAAPAPVVPLRPASPDGPVGTDAPLADPDARHAPPQPEPADARVASAVDPEPAPSSAVPEPPVIVAEPAPTTRVLGLLARRRGRPVPAAARRPLQRLRRRLAALAEEIAEDIERDRGGAA